MLQDVECRWKNVRQECVVKVRKLFRAQTWLGSEAGCPVVCGWIGLRDWDGTNYTEPFACWTYFIHHMHVSWEHFEGRCIEEYRDILLLHKHGKMHKHSLSTPSLIDISYVVSIRSLNHCPLFPVI